MAVENIQNIMKLALISNMMKNKSDDSGVFDIIMYSLLDSISNNTSSTNTPLNNSADISNIINNDIVANFNNNKLDYENTLNKVAISSENKNTDMKIDMAVKNASKKYSIDENLIKARIKKDMMLPPITAALPVSKRDDYTPPMIPAAEPQEPQQAKPPATEDGNAKKLY